MNAILTTSGQHCGQLHEFEKYVSIWPLPKCRLLDDEFVLTTFKRMSTYLHLNTIHQWSFVTELCGRLYTEEWITYVILFIVILLTVHYALFSIQHFQHVLFVKHKQIYFQLMNVQICLFRTWERVLRIHNTE